MVVARLLRDYCDDLPPGLDPGHAGRHAHPEILFGLAHQSDATGWSDKGNRIVCPPWRTLQPRKGLTSRVGLLVELFEATFTLHATGLRGRGQLVKLYTVMACYHGRTSRTQLWRPLAAGVLHRKDKSRGLTFRSSSLRLPITHGTLRERH